MSQTLFDAISSNDTDALIQALAQGADPNAAPVNQPEWSPLKSAIESLGEGGSIDAVVILLRHGALVDGANGDGASPLIVAVYCSQMDAVRVLLSAGANPNCRDNEGDSPVRLGVEHADYAVVKLLLQCGAARSIDGFGGPSGLSALGRAAWMLNIPMIELLLKWGADRASLDGDRLPAFKRLPARSSSNAPAWDSAVALLTS